jgi:hypothetical protein
MLLKKDYEGGLLATLIQDQEQMRNHDSRNHLPGFVRFNFLIPQFLCGDFFNSIGHFRPSSAGFAYRPLPLSPKSGHSASAPFYEYTP